MSEVINCVRCGSERVIPDVAMGSTVASVSKIPGAASIRHQKPVVGRICADCGSVDLSVNADDRAELWERYEKFRRDGDR